MCLTCEQKKLLKKAKGKKMKLVIVADCYNCSKTFKESDLVWSDQWCGKVCKECYYKEEDQVECVQCGEMCNDWVKLADGTLCCEECYTDEECGMCGEKIIWDNICDDVGAEIFDKYLEEHDNGDCCAACMKKIVGE
tara:strand:- start:40 stop:450 length:411 start_codon:yes stop_codon:yes gene_type:complete